MENSNEEYAELDEAYLKVDRLLRSYVTAMTIGDVEQLTQVEGELMDYQSHPSFVNMVTSTIGPLVAYTIQWLAEVDVDEVFPLWSKISQDIEMELILGVPDLDEGDDE